VPPPAQADALAPGAAPNLASVAPLFRLQAGDLRLARATTDGLGYRHFKYRQQIGGEDVYVKFGAEPTTSSYDFRSITATNNESITPGTIKAGTYFVVVQGYTVYSGLSLNASFTP
jgi:hypothetical protein